jgi:hypothetical protein
MSTKETKIPSKRYPARTDRDLISDVAHISALPPTFVSRTVTTILTYVGDKLLSGYAVRIKGVGLLAIKKTYLGNWTGAIYHSPSGIPNLKILKQRELVNYLATNHKLCDDPVLTYTSFWETMADIIRDRLNGGYEINVLDIGVIIPGNYGAKNARWHISPLTQCKLTQKELDSYTIDNTATA